MTNQLRVGVVLSTRPDIGGGSTYETAVVERIQELESSQTAFFYIRKVDGKYRVADTKVSQGRVPESVFQRLRTFHLPKRSERKSDFLAAVSQLELDILYFASPVQAISENTGVPFIATVWDLGILELPHFPEFRSHYGDSMHRTLAHALPRAYRVIVDSRATLQTLSHTFGLDPRKVLPAGLPLLSDMEITQPGFRLPEKFVIYPAKLWAHKNHRTIFSAFTRVVDAIPDARLVLSGIDGSDLAPLKRLVADFEIEGSVIILPRLPRSELNWVIKSAKALLMPTLLGPTNYPPLEAAALGVRALISDIHQFDFQLPETFRVIPSLDPEAWSDAIVSALADEASPEVFRAYDSFSEQLQATLTTFRTESRLWKGLGQ